MKIIIEVTTQSSEDLFDLVSDYGYRDQATNVESSEVVLKVKNTFQEHKFARNLINDLIDDKYNFKVEF